MRRDRRATWRRECLTPRRHRPGWCIFGIIKLNRRNTDNFSILHVNENRAAIGVVGVTPLTVNSWRAIAPCYRLDHPQCFHEPQRQLLRALDNNRKGLCCIDELLMIQRRGQQLRADLGRFECQTDLGFSMHSSARFKSSVSKLIPATSRAITRFDLGN